MSQKPETLLLLLLTSVGFLFLVYALTRLQDCQDERMWDPKTMLAPGTMRNVQTSPAVDRPTGNQANESNWADQSVERRSILTLEATIGIEGKKRKQQTSFVFLVNLTGRWSVMGLKQSRCESRVLVRKSTQEFVTYPLFCGPVMR